MKIKEIIRDCPESRVYFCSDLHYNHFNAIRHASRPFTTLEEMNHAIIQELKILRPEDVLFDLGDLFWNCSPDVCINFLSNIPCPIYKTIGNHDKHGLWYGKSGERVHSMVKSVQDIYDFRLENEKGREFRLILSHYPLASWNHKSRGSVMLHGHCHGSWDKINDESRELRVDVGWDAALSKELGKMLIPWSDIEKHFTTFAGDDFYKYVTSKKFPI